MLIKEKGLNPTLWTYIINIEELACDDLWGLICGLRCSEGERSEWRSFPQGRSSEETPITKPIRSRQNVKPFLPKTPHLLFYREHSTGRKQWLSVGFFTFCALCRWGRTSHALLGRGRLCTACWVSWRIRKGTRKTAWFGGRVVFMAAF